MKPWLLNILACPIDKHHPLDAYFFTWETPIEELSENAENAGTPSSKYEKNYGQIVRQLMDSTISYPSMRKIIDSSDSKEAKSLLAGALRAISELEKVEDKSEEKLLKNFLSEIDSINRFLHLIEVDVGILFCPECGRWYPIGSAVETIPEMLPDELREKERDLEWMEKWKSLIPMKVLESGKPYVI